MLLELLVLDGHLLNLLHLRLAAFLLLTKNLVLEELLVAAEDIGGLHGSSFLGAKEALDHLPLLKAKS